MISISDMGLHPAFWLAQSFHMQNVSPINDVLTRIFAQYGDRPAVIGLGGDVVTFDDLNSARARIGKALIAAHLTPAHRVATLLPDAPATAILLLGLTTRLSVLPLNGALLQSELADLIARAGVDALIADTRDPLAVELAQTTGIPVIDATQLCNGQPNAIVAPPDVTRQPGLILLTSGSTGSPKMVVTTPDAMLASARNIGRTLTLGPDDRALHALPMFHIGAVVDLLLAPLLCGGATIVCPDRTPTALAFAIAKGGATWMQLVPTMLIRCLAEFDAAKLCDMCAPLRFIRSVSADLSADTQALAERQCDTPIIQMYGMTETAGQICSNPLDGGGRKPNSVGPAAGAEIAILDASGNFLGQDQQGEVCAKGPTVFAGYEGQSNEDTFFNDWFRTGDLGRLDSDGYLFLTGRKKEMINQGGEKISPLEIERAALTCVGVTEAAAYPLPHPTLGDQPGLTVVGDVDAATVLAHLSTQLADYKCPRKVKVIDAMPRLGGGKVDKRRLIADNQSKAVQMPATVYSGQSRKIADLWSMTLQTDLPLAETDFFDAGGDSLAATTFILELEKLLGSSVDPNLLFNAPVFGDMLDAIAKVPATSQTEAPVLIYVRQMMAGWPGSQPFDGAIIRSLGTASTGQPIFWCGTEGYQGEVLQQALGNQHPIHSMMSTSQFKGRDDDDRDALAEKFATDIAQIAPDGPLVLGGFCDGGRIAALAAEKLQNAGRTIRCFIAIDHWFTQPTFYPVFHVFSHDRLYSGAAHFYDHAVAFPVLHPRGTASLHIGRGHGIDGPSLQALSAQLRPFISGEKRFAPTSPPTHSFGDRSKLYRAKLVATPSRLYASGAAVSFTATVTNLSDMIWPATSESGLCLVAHAINFDRHIRKRNVAVARLETALASGETRGLEMIGTYPETRMPLILQINMSDQGLCDWNHGTGGRVTRVIWPKFWGK